MKGSGKQVLLNIIRRLSTRILGPELLADATKQIRSGLLLHGSTAEESFEHMAHLRWGSIEDQWGRKQQGIASTSGILLIQFVDALLETQELEAHVRNSLPELSNAEYHALEHSLRVVVSAMQMYEEVNNIEVNEEDLDVEGWVKNLTSKYEHHFLRQGKLPPK